jgi:hypothetical protein
MWQMTNVPRSISLKIRLTASNKPKADFFLLYRKYEPKHATRSRRGRRDKKDFNHLIL